MRPQTRRLPIGVAMGCSKIANGLFEPFVELIRPVPISALIPLVILFVGIGFKMKLFVALLGAIFPVLLNTWSGVRAVNPIWLRAAGAMGANERALFWKVIMPGASPFIITGLRQAFLRAWIAVIGAEFLAASDFGLGWVIFDAKEFLNAPLMLASLIVIGTIGFAFERLVFGSIEKATVLRWGMVRMVKG